MKMQILTQPYDFFCIKWVCCNHIVSKSLENFNKNKK